MESGRGKQDGCGLVTGSELWFRAPMIRLLMLEPDPGPTSRA